MFPNRRPHGQEQLPATGGYRVPTLNRAPSLEPLSGYVIVLNTSALTVCAA
jgi:hypothetical protein